MAYSFSRSLTIDHTKCGSTDSSNFPVLFGGPGGPYAYLATIANGGKVQNTVAFNGQTVPADLKFTSDSGGTTLLSWEVASYNPVTGDIEVWIKVPTVSHTVDTVIYMFYGDASVSTYQGGSVGAAWDANFDGVWHFADGTTLSLKDSTSTANNGTNTGTSAVAGKIDGGISATTTGKHVAFANVSNALHFTIYGWINIPDNTNINQIVAGLSDSTRVDWRLDQTTGVQDLLESGIVSIATSNTKITANTWHQIAVTYDLVTVKFYLDGAPDGSTAATQGFTGGGFNAFGVDSSAGGLFGKFDELQSSNVVRSADWILAEYNNQNLPDKSGGAGGFYTVGTEVSSNLSENLNDTETLSDSLLFSLGIVELITDFNPLSDSSQLFNTVGEVLNFSDTLGIGSGHNPGDSFGLLDSLLITAPPGIIFVAPSGIWTNNQISQWAEDAIGQIAIEVNCIWQREAITIKQGVSVVTLPSYLRSLSRVTWRGRTLDAENWEELTMLTPATVFLAAGSPANVESSQSRPLYYAQHPTNPYDIRLYPTPNETFFPNGEPDVYSPQANSPSCIIDFYREPDTTNTNPIISLPPYILRRTQKAYVLWKAYASEGKGQDLKAASYFHMKYSFLIEQFRAINQGCFIGKRYSIDDGMLSIDGFRYPRPQLPSQFESVRF